MPASRSLVTPTANPLLERALLDKLQRRMAGGGGVGELEPLAVRLGLVQNTLKPRLREPQLLLFAADHGLAVEGIAEPGQPTTSETVHKLLRQQLPIAAFARTNGLELTVVDCGMAENPEPHERLLVRKIAHATRNARLSPAMSLEQAHAGLRAGMEIGDQLRGNVTVLAGLGVGSLESAALVLSRLTQCALHDLISSGADMDPDLLAHRLVVAKGAQGRHREVTEPVEVLAAFGGFEVAVMAGVMLMAASKRHLLMVDGMPACAALMLAARIALPVTDYSLFCRSHGHRGLDTALSLFRATALLELGMNSSDGTGATLAWPLVRSAAALLTEVGEDEDAGPSHPVPFADSVLQDPDTMYGPLGPPSGY